LGNIREIVKFMHSCEVQTFFLKFIKVQ